MNIGVTGATGFIGRRLVELAGQRGHTLIGFSRDLKKPIVGCAETRRFAEDAAMDVGGCEALVHLAGESVFGVWTPEKKRRIRDSRVAGTRSVVDAMQAAPEPPRVLVCSSGIGIYGDTGDRVVTEDSAPGEGFLAGVAVAWEAEARRAAEAGARVVTVRTAMVLGRGGGALGMMAPMFKLGLGGELGSGRQWVAWIHLDDVVNLFLHAVENEAVSGPLNGTAPEPVRNADFTDTLAEVLHRPAIFDVPAFLLRVALGGFSAELLESRRAMPARVVASGFVHRHPELRGALQSALGRVND